MMQPRWFAATFALTSVCAVASGCIAELAAAATNTNVTLRIAYVGVAALTISLGAVATLRAAGADFGPIELSCSMIGCSQVSGLLVVLLALTMDPHSDGEFWIYMIPIAGSIQIFLVMNVRYPLIFLMWLLGNAGPSSTMGSSVLCVNVLCTCYMPYLRDQRLGLMTGICLFNYCLLGGNLISSRSNDRVYAWINPTANAVFGYVIYLFARRRRNLPPSLRNCKFVRLGYLRAMLFSGKPLRRCQEMPVEAFGDPKKAAYVIITSHRWLDRWKCDVPTTEFPAGLRLTTMVQRLDRMFPQSCAGACQGQSSFVSSIWRGVCHGGSDVLVFFDFSGLPQIGKADNGEDIPRTDEEASQFYEALPSMGVFYTMFPVLVLQEVTGDVHPYFSSGWCSSEFYSAMLANTLAPFSTAAISDYLDWLAQGSDASGARMSPKTLESLNVGTLDPSAVDDFNNVFENDLAQKKFFDERDRTAVRTIVQGFLLKRLLMDAISNQDESGVKRLLAEVQEKDMIEMLGHPVDESLDTLLHRAARLPSLEIVQALLQAGASPSALNLRGDSPPQFFALPRLTAGARLCRSRQGSQAQQQYAAISMI